MRDAEAWADGFPVEFYARMVSLIRSIQADARESVLEEAALELEDNHGVPIYSVVYAQIMKLAVHRIRLMKKGGAAPPQRGD